MDVLEERQAPALGLVGGLWIEFGQVVGSIYVRRVPNEQDLDRFGLTVQVLGTRFPDVRNPASRGSGS